MSLIFLITLSPKFIIFWYKNKPFLILWFALSTLCQLQLQIHQNHRQFPHKQSNYVMCGPMDVSSQYFVSFIDDHRRYITIYLLKNKSEVVVKLKEFCEAMKTRFNKYPYIIRLDNGGEYINAEVDTFHKSCCI